MSNAPWDLQLVVDCADPHALADWWAEALGWVVEESDEPFIRSMVAQGFADETETKQHNGKLVWASGAAIRHPGGLERAPRVLFQQVPEAKAVKNRVHWDLRSLETRSDADIDRLVALGATIIGEGQQGPHAWVVMADPEGNEFCI